MNNESDPLSPSYQPYYFQNDDLFIPHVDEEPLYVNAKQYFRILKRRVARARLEELHRLSRQRKVSSVAHQGAPTHPSAAIPPRVAP